MIPSIPPLATPQRSSLVEIKSTNKNQVFSSISEKYTTGGIYPPDYFLSNIFFQDILIVEFLLLIIFEAGEYILPSIFFQYTKTAMWYIPPFLFFEL